MGPQNQEAKQKSVQKSKGNDFYKTYNANSVGIQRKTRNMLEYRSDPFGNNWNLSKHFLLLNTF